MMDTPFEAVAKGNSEFSREFYRVVAEAEPGNLVSSPMSCLIALAMAHAGAKGDSIPKIARGLRLPENITDALQGLSEVVEQLREAPSVELSIANKIYVKQDFPILEEYSTALEKYFQVEAENVVFTDPSTADKINDWVSNQTKDKIKNLVDSNSFDGLTRLVLVNAIYFKGPWLKPFKKDKTHNRPFFTDENNSVEVPFMYQKTHFPYNKLDELDAQLLVMPYEGLELSMAIILPNKKEGLKELEEKLATADLGKLLQSGYPRDVEVYLPKFKIETSLDLVDHLSKMGLSHIFSDDVNLTGISIAEELKVSKVVQKAFIEVSEEGTEAAAATGKFKSILHVYIVLWPSLWQFSFTKGSITFFMLKFIIYLLLQKLNQFCYWRRCCLSWYETIHLTLNENEPMWFSEAVSLTLLRFNQL
ncbi:Hypothetical predicted protein [Cloeon dipterum]|nr:Hypothetical predicted protein [Cloeon dipterum]